MIDCDTLIVGAGPIGLELAVSLQHAGVDYRHLEAGQVAHTVTWYPRQTKYFSSPERIAIAGVPLTTPDQSKASREQYLAYLRGVVQQFDLRIQTHEPVTQLTRLDDDTFIVETTKATYHAQRVVLAIGDMHAPRRLDIPGEDLPHVSHYFDEPHNHFRRRLLIVGGRNSAVEAALRCHRAGSRVALSYRKAAFDEDSIKYWLLPEIKGLIKHGEIDFYPETVPVEITPTHVRLAPAPSAEAASAADSSDLTPVPAESVLLLTGYTQDRSLFRQAGVTLEGENHAPTFDPETMMTDVPHLYIAGTAAAGTQNHFKLFIENCHRHVTRITRSITGEAARPHLVNSAVETFGLPES